MRLTERLNIEHEELLAQLEGLEGMVRREEPVAGIRTAALALGEAVERHRDVEERVLFPVALRELGSGFPPVHVMEAEHAEIGRCLEEIASAEPRVVPGVRRLATLLPEHFAKETQVLFPMIDARVPREELERLAAPAQEGDGR